jgi:hypothetical protein
MARRFSLASLVLLGSTFAACAGFGGDGVEGETSSSTPDANPTTGAWVYLEGASISDSCMLPVGEIDASTEFGMSNNGDGSFTVAREGQDIECEIDGESFTCLPVPLDPISADGLDAVFNLEVTYVGTFPSDTSIDGERTIDATCTGTACGGVEALYMMNFPCALVDAFTASYG